MGKQDNVHCYWQFMVKIGKMILPRFAAVGRVCFGVFAKVCCSGVEVCFDKMFYYLKRMSLY